MAPTSSSVQTFDVVICGGGLAGLTLARQLRRALPTWSIALVERTARPLPEAACKVGESSVEIGSQYFERLGLTEYLLSRQLVKFGLRFFPGGGDMPIEQRTEIGPSQEPPVRSYQLDRGRFENDLREMNEQLGVRLFEGYRVRAVQLAAAGENHVLDIVPVSAQSSLQAQSSFQAQSAMPTESVTEAPIERASQRLAARWVIDATGREALLRKQLELSEPTGHVAHAGWFRVAGRIDITKWVEPTPDNAAWHGHEWANNRWRSTNHFMGAGYWAWIIPLASGNTSVGIVVHDERFSFNTVRTYEQCLEFLASHEPHVHRRVSASPPLDFRCLKGYSHTARALWSAERFAIVGEAGAFVDPLYSPGSDFIAFANSFTTELLLADSRGEDLTGKVERFNARYRALVSNAIDLFRHAAPVYGHARAMAAKVYFDNFAYWSFLAQYYVQDIYALDGSDHDAYVNLGIRFAELSNRVQLLLRAWANHVPHKPVPGFVGMPRFPSLLVDAYMDLQKRLTADEAKALLELRLEQGREIADELALRVLLETSVDSGRQILAEVGDSAWTWSEARLAAEYQTGVTRRKGLSPAVRDVERTLGRAIKHPHWEQVVERLRGAGEA